MLWEVWEPKVNDRWCEDYPRNTYFFPAEESHLWQHITADDSMHRTLTFEADDLSAVHKRLDEYLFPPPDTSPLFPE